MKERILRIVKDYFTQFPLFTIKTGKGDSKIHICDVIDLTQEDTIPDLQSLTIGLNGQIPISDSAAGDFKYSSLNVDTNSNILSYIGKFSLQLSGRNLAIGFSTLRDITSGTSNTAIGFLSIVRNTTGSFNTGLGDSTLYYNTNGLRNTAVGAAALVFGTSISDNTAIGYDSLLNNQGDFNTALGALSGNRIANGTGLINATNGLYLGYNTRPSLDGNTNEIIIGANAVGNGSNSATLGNDSITETYLKGKINIGGSPTTPYELTVLGKIALNDNSNSLFIGNGAGENTTGTNNIGIGNVTLNSNTTGAYNIGLGSNALNFNTTGNSNIAIGDVSLSSNTTGGLNLAIGDSTLANNTLGSFNVALGPQTLDQNTEGDYNIAIGYLAGNSAIGGANNTTSNNSIYIGYDTKPSLNGNTNEIVIGHASLGNGSNTITLGNDSILTTFIKGKISMADSAFSVFIGEGTGRLDTGINGYNVGLGYQSLYSNTVGYQNNASGFQSMYSNVDGYDNDAKGYSSLYSNTSGYSNVTSGSFSLAGNTTGFLNTAIGFEAGRYVNAGTANMTSNTSLYLGADSRASASGNVNEIVIGNSSRGNGSNTVTLGNSSITDTYLQGNVNADSFAGDGTLITNVPDTITVLSHALDRKINIVDASSNAVTVTLPDVTINLGREFTIVAYDATNTVTIDTIGAQEIRRTVLDIGNTSVVLAAGEIYKVVATGVYWQII